MAMKPQISLKEVILLGCILLCCGVINVSADPPANWYRSDEGLTLTSSSSTIPEIFCFDGRVYVNSDSGLFVQLYNNPCFGWKQVTTAPAGAGSFKPVGDYLYASGTSLWWIGHGDSNTNPTWNLVTSTGTPAGATILPKTIFNGQLYAAVVSTAGSFDIYRTPDIGSTSMTWTKVVSDGFGDPLNHDLGCLIVYNSKIIAVTTNTRTLYSAWFGDYNYYGSGIEVWESATGNSGSWTQINTDGFGTEGSVPLGGGSYLTVRTNQDFGSAAVYNGYLYVGTLAHTWHRGEVWRYSGTGLSGWTDVTPDGMCSGMIGCGGPSRAAAMTVYDGLLYLGEGVATGNLEAYNGTSWSVVVPGELDLAYVGHPFTAENLGIYSLAVLPSLPTLPGNPSTGDKLFALTKTTGGCQIWSYPFSSPPPTCTALKLASVTITPDTATSQLFPGATHSYNVLVNAGTGFDFSQVLISVTERVDQYYGGGGSSSTGSGFVPPTGTWTSGYEALYQGPTALQTDDIRVCIYNSETTVCDYATNIWVDISSELGVFRPSTHTFYLDYNRNGAWNGVVTDRAFNFGLTGDVPVSGDWNNDGLTEIGVFRPSTHMFYLDYNGNGAWNGAVTDRQFNFGLTGDVPVSGDWDNDGFTEIGVFRPSTHMFYLDYNGNGTWNGAVTDKQYNFGTTGDIPVSGDWYNNGISGIGVFRPSTHTFYLDYNGNGAWNGAVTDRQYDFGLTSDSPFSGNWG
jgi:hypothetical protein